jgi:transposase
MESGPVPPWQWASPRSVDTLTLDLRSRGRGVPMGRPSKYTPEFRRDAVDLVVNVGRPIVQVARELGMSHKTLMNWVGAERRSRTAQAPTSGGGRAGGSLADKDAEIARLRRENAQLRQDREILRKAAAFFVKEMDR